MAQHQFERLLSDLTQFTEPTSSSNPMWKPKSRTEGSSLSNKCTNCHKSMTPSSKSRCAKCQTAVTPSSKSRCSTSKTPSKTPGGKTPKKTPSHDRFIPNRATTDFDSGHYAVMKADEAAPTNVSYQNQLNEVLNNGQDPKAVSILNFTEKVHETQDNNARQMRVLYSQFTGPKPVASRQICKQPDRVLDAPELLDDYYLSLMDWSQTNHLVVALGSSVYSWNAEDGSIDMLMEISQSDEYVSSVKFMSGGPILAVGSSAGYVQLWDITKHKCLRTMAGHSSRVGSMSWNFHILSSGSRSGAIHHHDVRVAEHRVGTLSGHVQEVCGLAWSLDSTGLASGGNDNLLNIWDTRLGNVSTPIHSLTEHTSAVKALAWCPWQHHLLASGGGTSDRLIRIWNTSSGACLNSVDTDSQVCAILWSSEYKELISGHGFAQNQLSIWKYPTLTKVTDLYGHKQRVLCLAMSPDQTSVVSAGADETIRLWKCFEKKHGKGGKTKSGLAYEAGMLSHNRIR